MKYGTEIDFESRNVNTILIDLIKNDSDILEFGPASGRLTKYLSEEKKCRMSIVEIDGDAGKLASEFAVDTVIGNIMDFEWVSKFENKKYDYILFADVLEHLSDAEVVLKVAREFLNDNGKVLISLPNITYNGVVLELIENIFKYNETGILDNTHVRFWSMDDAQQMFKRCGYGIELRDAIYNPLQHSEFSLDYGCIPSVVGDYLKLRPYGEVYQLVYSLSKYDQGVMEDRINQLNNYYFVQHFFDIGEGYKESYVKYIDSSNSKISEVVEIPLKARSFRLDPMNSKCLVKVKAFDSKGNVLPVAYTNGIYIDDFFCFNHDDPQIEFSVDKNIGKLTYDISYIMYQSDVCFDIIVNKYKQKQDIIDQKENYIEELRDIINEKDKNIINLNNTISIQSNTISNKNDEILSQKDTIATREGEISTLSNSINNKEKIIENYENFTSKFLVKLLYKLYCKIRESKK